MNVGLIGYGYWGPILSRNFYSNPNFNLKRVADFEEKRLKLAAGTFPGLEVTSDPSEITRANDIDVVAIATPVFTHYELAKEALLNGKHVFLEKPMTSKLDEAKELTELADKNGLTIMVDYTFLFTPSVGKIKEMIDTGDLGDLYYYDSIRINLGLFQHDINVVWDLAPHDLSIMDFLLGPDQRALSAHGSAHFDTGFEDVSYLTIYYDNNLIAHIHVNWLSPVKLRHTLVSGSKKMLLWDDLSMDEKIKIYDRGVKIENKEGVYGILPHYRLGDVHVPRIEGTEALKNEVEYFYNCIDKSERPHNDGEAGIRIVNLLEAADKSLRNKGQLIEF